MWSWKITIMIRYFDGMKRLNFVYLTNFVSFKKWNPKIFYKIGSLGVPLGLFSPRKKSSHFRMKTERSSDTTQIGTSIDSNYSSVPDFYSDYCEQSVKMYFPWLNQSWWEKFSFRTRPTMTLKISYAKLVLGWFFGWMEIIQKIRVFIRVALKNFRADLKVMDLINLN